MCQTKNALCFYSGLLVKPRPSGKGRVKPYTVKSVVAKEKKRGMEKIYEIEIVNL